MNDAIVCEKCKYDLFMICPDGLTVCNHCGEFSTVPNAPPAIPADLRSKVLELCETIIDAEDCGALVDDVMDFNLPRQIREMMGEA